MPRPKLIEEIKWELKRLASHKKKRQTGRVNLSYVGQSDLESFLETLRGMK